MWTDEKVGLWKFSVNHTVMSQCMSKTVHSNESFEKYSHWKTVEIWKMEKKKSHFSDRESHFSENQKGPGHLSQLVIPGCDFLTRAFMCSPQSAAIHLERFDASASHLNIRITLFAVERLTERRGGVGGRSSDAGQRGQPRRTR